MNETSEDAPCIVQDEEASMLEGEPQYLCIAGGSRKKVLPLLKRARCLVQAGAVKRYIDCPVPATKRTSHLGQVGARRNDSNHMSYHWVMQGEFRASTAGHPEKQFPPFRPLDSAKWRHKWLHALLLFSSAQSQKRHRVRRRQAETHEVQHRGSGREGGEDREDPWKKNVFDGGCTEDPFSNFVVDASFSGN